MTPYSFKTSHLLGALQQDMCAIDVVLRKLEGVAEGVVHVRLSRKMQYRIDLFFTEHVAHQIRRAYVPLYKLGSLRVAVRVATMAE